MQTFTELASKVIGWERVSLANGAYRLQNVSVREDAINFEGYTDCTTNAQFADELGCVKAKLGLTGGIWLGLVMELEAYAQVFALLLE